MLFHVLLETVGIFLLPMIFNLSTSLTFFLINEWEVQSDLLTIILSQFLWWRFHGRRGREDC